VSTPAADLPAATLPDPAAIPPAVDADPAWAAAARAWLVQSDARFARRFDAGEPADKLVALRARAVDTLVRDAWQRCIPEGDALALFAVGGYGRGELFPQSDIDLLVLAEPDVQRAAQPALARFVALLWDAGLQASPAVRSAAECTEAAADQTVLTALIEARPLVAWEEETAALRATIAPDRAWAPRAFLEAKVAEQRQRHARFGDTSDNLEPNIKDGPGGLRDLHMLGWLALRSFGVRDLDALVGLGHLGPGRSDRAGARTARPVPPALRPAPGRRSPRRTPALRLPEAAGRAIGLRRRRRLARGREDDAGLLPQRGDRAPDQ
jgi:[protein-PII] uridylyltransferase